MIWAIVSSQSFFCRLYRASPFGCKEYSQSDFCIDHLMMSMCRVFSWVVGRGCLLWPVCSLGKTLLAFGLLHSVLTPRPNLTVIPRISWLPIFAFQSPMMKRTSIFGVSSRRVFTEPFNFSFFSISVWDTELDYCDTKWFALETNRDHSVIFEIAPKFCILDFCWLWWLLHFF